MKTAVGIFSSREDARRAMEALLQSGFSADRVTLLAPGAPEGKVHSVPTSETEQPGMGKAVGGVVGGVTGAAAGMGLGAAVASLFIPGVGPVAAVGLLGAALLGAGGAVGGAVAGGALEDSLSKGLPKDEIYLYEDALRKGRSVVVALAEDEEGADRARAILLKEGAESLDAAREAWWTGLRTAEEGEYEGPDFAGDETPYRRGFEAGASGDTRPEAEASSAFRRGYERGKAYRESFRRA
jgi:hypothetical protein